MESRAHMRRELSARGRADLELILKRNASSYSSLNGSFNAMARRVPKGRVPYVCVVGAGVAGLRCADVLSQNGFKVTIVEGRDRIGGRVCKTSYPR